MNEPTKKLTGKGGTGRGQGRKYLSETDPTQRGTVTLPKTYWEHLRDLCEGNASAGIRMLVEEYMARIKK